MSEKTTSYSGGIGFFGLLTVLLIGLKLTGYIDPSWWLIAAIFFAPLLIVLSIFLVGAILLGLAALIARVS